MRKIFLGCLFAMSCMNNNQSEKAIQEASVSEVNSSESSEAQNVAFWDIDLAKDYPETINSGMSSFFI